MPTLSADRLPKYRLHKQSGRALVTLGGRDVMLGKHGTAASRQRYERLVAEWIAHGRRTDPGPCDDLTVDMMLARFCDHAEVKYQGTAGNPSAELANFRCAMIPLRKLYGQTPAAKFGPLALKTVRQRMTDGGSCRNYANHCIRRIRYIFRWAVENELLPPSTWHGLQSLEGLRRGQFGVRESDPVKPVPRELLDATFPYLNRHVRTIAELQLLTAARQGEICCMRTCDIDRSGEEWKYRPRTHKTSHHGHTRVIYLGPRSQKILAPFLVKLNLQAPIFSPADAERERREALTAARKTPPTYGNGPGTNRKRKPKKVPGEMYADGSYTRAIAVACAKAFPIPPKLREPAEPDADPKAAAKRAAARKAWVKEHRWHPHQLRHNKATDVRKTDGLEGAQAMLGHASVSATQTYAEKNEEISRRIAAKYG